MSTLVQSTSRFLFVNEMPHLFEFIHKLAICWTKDVFVQQVQPMKQSLTMYSFVKNAIIIYSGIFLVTRRRVYGVLYGIRFILKAIRLCYGTWLLDSYVSALLIPVHCFTIVLHASLGCLCHLFFFPRYGCTCSGFVRPGLSEQCFK